MSREITPAKIRRFVTTRNSSAYTSNLQFQIDADYCGFSISDLPDAIRFEPEDGGTGYLWNLPFGKLVEENGTLRFDEF